MNKGLSALIEWTQAYIEKSHSELPDSAFACILPGGSKDATDGKTHPLNLRKYPHHRADGSLDPALVRSALSRLGDDANEQCGKAHIEAAAKDLGIGESDDKSFDLDDDEIMAAVEAALSKQPEA